LDRPLVQDLCNIANEATLAELTIGIAETLDAAAQEAKLGDFSRSDCRLIDTHLPGRPRGRPSGTPRIPYLQR
jgi:hypothetical protein